MNEKLVKIMRKLVRRGVGAGEGGRGRRSGSPPTSSGSSGSWAPRRRAATSPPTDPARKAEGGLSPDRARLRLRLHAAHSTEPSVPSAPVRAPSQYEPGPPVDGVGARRREPALTRSRSRAGASARTRAGRAPASPGGTRASPRARPRPRRPGALAVGLRRRASRRTGSSDSERRAPLGRGRLAERRRVAVGRGGSPCGGSTGGSSADGLVERRRPVASGSADRGLRPCGGPGRAARRELLGVQGTSLAAGVRGRRLGELRLGSARVRLGRGGGASAVRPRGGRRRPLRPELLGLGGACAARGRGPRPPGSCDLSSLAPRACASAPGAP